MVQPGRVGGREVEVDPRILLQELADGDGFVSGEIVQDDVNLLVSGPKGDDFLEESNELAAGVASGGFAMNPSCGRVQGGIEGERSVAEVLETVAFGTSGRKRQNRVQPVQCLNRRLFIHTEHRGVARRIQVQPNDIGGFGFEVRIVAGHVAFQTMRFQAGFLPGAMHGIFADTQDRSQLAATPVRRAILRLSPRADSILARNVGVTTVADRPE